MDDRLAAPSSRSATYHFLECGGLPPLWGGRGGWVKSIDSRFSTGTPPTPERRQAAALQTRSRGASATRRPATRPRGDAPLRMGRAAWLQGAEGHGRSERRGSARADTPTALRPATAASARLARERRSGRRRRARARSDRSCARQAMAGHTAGDADHRRQCDRQLGDGRRAHRRDGPGGRGGQRSEEAPAARGSQAQRRTPRSRRRDRCLAPPALRATARHRPPTPASRRRRAPRRAALRAKASQRIMTALPRVPPAHQLQLHLLVGDRGDTGPGRSGRGRLRGVRPARRARACAGSSNCACCAAMRSASACASLRRCSSWSRSAAASLRRGMSRRMAKRARSSLPPPSARPMSSSSARSCVLAAGERLAQPLLVVAHAPRAARACGSSSISASRTYCLSSSERSSSDSTTPCASALGDRGHTVGRSCEVPDEPAGAAAQPPVLAPCALLACPARAARRRRRRRSTC